MMPETVRMTVALGLNLLTLLAQGQTVHAILVADTHDPSLHNVCRRDMDIMHRQFVQLASAIGYRLSEQVIAGDKFGNKRLRATLRDLKPGPTDIIFLYYTGHGYHASQRTGRFPVLWLEKDRSVSQQNPGLLTLHQTLKAKRARFCVTLGDCCNNLVSDMRGMAKRPVAQGIITLDDDSLNAAYRTLFLNVRGDALIASSQPPQQACAHPDSGSFYTRSFDEALSLARRKKNVTWKTLLSDTQTQLTRHRATRTKQSIYELNIVAANSPQALTPLTVTLRTDRGRTNVEYREGNELIVEAKANRPCHLRLVYLQADGIRTLFEDDVEIKPGQENQFIRIAPDVSYICAGPFGMEQLLVYAAEESFCPLPTSPNPGLYIKNEDGYAVFVGSMPDMMKAVTCTKNGLPVAADRIQIMTRASERKSE